MLFFVMTYWKNLQLLGALPPDPYQGLCPWTPLGAYCSPQTPASFSSFFTFAQSHVLHTVILYFCVFVNTAKCGGRFWDWLLLQELCFVVVFAFVNDWGCNLRAVSLWSSTNPMDIVIVIFQQHRFWGQASKWTEFFQMFVFCHTCMLYLFIAHMQYFASVQNLISMSTVWICFGVCVLCFLFISSSRHCKLRKVSGNDSITARLVCECVCVCVCVSVCLLWVNVSVWYVRVHVLVCLLFVSVCLSVVSECECKCLCTCACVSVSFLLFLVLDIYLVGAQTISKTIGVHHTNCCYLIEYESCVKCRYKYFVYSELLLMSCMNIVTMLRIWSLPIRVLEEKNQKSACVQRMRLWKCGLCGCCHWTGRSSDLTSDFKYTYYTVAHKRSMRQLFAIPASYENKHRPSETRRSWCACSNASPFLSSHFFCVWATVSMLD